MCICQHGKSGLHLCPVREAAAQTPGPASCSWGPASSIQPGPSLCPACLTAGSCFVFCDTCGICFVFCPEDSTKNQSELLSKTLILAGVWYWDSPFILCTVFSNTTSLLESRLSAYLLSWCFLFCHLFQLLIRTELKWLPYFLCFRAVDLFIHEWNYLTSLLCSNVTLCVVDLVINLLWDLVKLFFFLIRRPWHCGHNCNLALLCKAQESFRVISSL